MGGRSEDAEIAANRIDEVIRVLEGASDETAQAPDYRLLARQLFPVARTFESLGFLSVSREVSYVERSLEELAPSVEEQPPPHAPQRIDAATATPESAGDTALERLELPAEDTTASTPPARFHIPTPLGVMLFVLLLTILGSIFVVRTHDQLQRRAALGSVDIPNLPSPTPSVPSASPTPRPAATPTPGARARVSQRIGEARLALRAGDLDRAISHVSAAALIDVDSSLVIDTAKEIVRELIARSDGAADQADWDGAARLLERARELSLRFGFPVDSIDDAAGRHARMVHYLRLGPDEIDAIRNSAGKRVIVYLKGGSTEEGRIRSVKDRSLQLDQSTGVGSAGRGGEVHYVEPIHLDLITEIRVFED
jgi:hypothetical protein